VLCLPSLTLLVVNKAELELCLDIYKAQEMRLGKGDGCYSDVYTYQLPLSGPMKIETHVADVFARGNS